MQHLLASRQSVEVVERRERFLGEVVLREEEVAAVVAMFDSVKAGVDALGGYSKKVKTMDWWGGIFEST